MTLTKRRAIVVVVVPLAVLLVTLGQAWITGSTSDPVLGRTTLTATGSQVVPAVVAVVLVAAAALVGLLTGGARSRPAAGVILVLASVGAAALVGTGLAAPAAALGRRAAELAGRTGAAVPVDAALTGWAVAAAVAAGTLTVGAVLAGRSAMRWSGLGRRFEPVEPASVDARGAHRSAWDELTEGHDPTRRDSADPT